MITYTGILHPHKPLDYVITYSGRQVSPHSGVPSKEDIALSLSRQPRFGGFCRRHWTVVDHSLFTVALAEKDGHAAAMQLALLLHDAHEWTGDIPTHFKTQEQRALQMVLDDGIYRAANAPRNYTQFPIIKEYDERALLAEALVVGPPSFKTSTDVLEHFGERPHLRDVVALVKRIEDGTLGVHPSEIAYGLDAANVRHFLHKLDALQGEA